MSQPKSRRGKNSIPLCAWRSISLVLGSALVLAGVQPTSAQQCALGDRVAFGGHSLPLDGSPDPQAMIPVVAFPNLSFDQPVYAAALPDDSNRLAVVEQPGRIRIFDDNPDVSSSTVFLDIRSLVDNSQNELGLLGLAFDPNFDQNGRFFVNYTASATCGPAIQTTYCTRIVRYEVSTNPDVANPSSASLIYEFEQTAAYHNGGMLAFGPDGYLYVSSGDGGANSSDALDLGNPRGAILRMDVSQGAPSLAPASNPFVGQAGATEEIFHYGLRNPWRFSFDRATGDLWIGDVGRASYEEIDYLAAGTPGGENFGWDQCEGDGHDGPASQPCGSTPYTPPVYEYAHGGGSFSSVTGGYVYRGDAFPELNGSYVFSDYGSREILAWDRTGGSAPIQIATANAGVVSFAEDASGELLMLELFGPGIFRLERAGSGGGSAGETFPTALSATGLFDDLTPLVPAPGMIEYSVESPLWSDDAAKRRWMALPGLEKIAFHATEPWGFPIGTVLVKQFDVERADGSFKKVETRVFVRQNTRWTGVTYQWNASETDAFLLLDGASVTLDLGAGQTQPYHFPSSADCLGCHNAFAGRTLGAKTRQLGGEFDYGGMSQTQLEALDCIGIFDTDLADPQAFERFAAIDDPTRSLSDRARSYLEVNCAVCHQPAGPAPTAIDLRLDQALLHARLIGEAPTEGNLGVPGAEIIKPGEKEESILWLRIGSTDPQLRMAPGTFVPHPDSVAEIGLWIDTALAVLDSDSDGVPDGSDVCPTVSDPGQQDSDFDGLGDACDPDHLPDLLVQSQNVPIAVAPGQSLALSAVATNQGGGSATDFPINFYLSEDLVFDRTQDASVGTCWLTQLAAGNSAGCQDTDARVPIDIAPPEELPAEFHWVVCADPIGAVPDADDGNDCEIDPVPVTVPEPGLGIGLSIGMVSLIIGARRRRATRQGMFRESR